MQRKLSLSKHYIETISEGKKIWQLRWIFALLLLLYVLQFHSPLLDTVFEKGEESGPLATSISPRR
jgi:hypothetical protein